jgi:hypothetical protein
MRSLAYRFASALFLKSAIHWIPPENQKHIDFHSERIYIPNIEREDIMQALHQIKHIDSTSLTLNLPKSFLNRTVEVTVVPRKGCAGKRHLKFKSFIMNPIKVKAIKPWTRDELYAR